MNDQATRRALLQGSALALVAGHAGFQHHHGFDGRYTIAVGCGPGTTPQVGKLTVYLAPG